MQLKALREIASTMTIPQLAKYFQRTPNQIRHAFRRFNIERVSPHARSNKEIENMTKYGRAHGFREAARKYKITYFTMKGISSRYRRLERKRMAAISGESLEKIRKVSLAYARKDYKLVGHVDDFASYAVMHAIETGKTFLDMRIVSSNYKRETFGSTRTKVGRIEAQVESLDQMQEDHGFDASAIDDLESPDMRMKRYHKLCEGLEIDRGYMRLMFFLHFIDGMSMREIAFRCGLSSTRISQFLGDVQQKLIDNKEHVRKILKGEM